MKKKLYTAIGLMSGTSMDGVDLSIISSDGYNEFFTSFDEYYNFDKKLQDQLIFLRDQISNEKDLSINSKKIREIERNLTLFHADVANQALQKHKNSVDLIGFHGQTIFHNPQKKLTKQLGDGKLLSQILKTKVIYDFRQADIENSGQGAPLTPIFHYILCKKIKKKFDLELPVGFLNIGGIANITKINNISEDFQKNLLAFDIGPGNCLIDKWVRSNTHQKYDVNGEIGKSGKVNELILNQAIENFKIQTFDKSLDIKDFDISFARGLSLEDGCATITNFTAYLIAKGLEHAAKNKNMKFLICGGGRKNNFLVQSINNNLVNNNIVLDKIDNYKLNGDYIESQAFGYLAIRSYLNLPISFSSTTGCNNSVVGGKLVENF